MEIKAPAKINLYLNVGKIREDSFHDIISIMVMVSMWDIITIEDNEDIIVEGTDWIPKEHNLAYRAAKLLKEHSGVNNGCKIKIEKNIPIGRGLGGGSSDCGTILKALNEMWKLNLSVQELEKIGEKLGSDVNFFLYPGGCLVQGRGEIVKPIDKTFKDTKNIIIIDTGIEISTKDIYRQYSGGKLTEKEELDKILSYYREGNWAEILRNDLENVVCKKFPVLKDLKNRLTNWGTHPLLSGSGSCIFTLVDNIKTAESVARIIKEDFKYNTWLVNPIIPET